MILRLAESARARRAADTSAASEVLLPSTATRILRYMARPQSVPGVDATIGATTRSSDRPVLRSAGIATNTLRIAYPPGTRHGSRGAVRSNCNSSTTRKAPRRRRFLFDAAVPLWHWFTSLGRRRPSHANRSRIGRSDSEGYVPWSADRRDHEPSGRPEVGAAAWHPRLVEAATPQSRRPQQF